MVLALAGCATTTSNYCDIATPLYFDSEQTVDYLSQNDEVLLREIVIANETWERLCS